MNMPFLHPHVVGLFVILGLIGLVQLAYHFTTKREDPKDLCPKCRDYKWGYTCPFCGARH